MAATQELVDYVKNRLEAEEPQLKIKDELKANGWTDEDVNEAFMANGIGAPPPKKKRSPWAIGFLVFSLIGFAVAGYFAYENLARPQAKFVLEKSFERLQNLKYYSTQITASAQASLSGQKISGEFSGTADNDMESIANPQVKTELVLKSSLAPEIRAKTVYTDNTFYFSSEYINGMLNSESSLGLPQDAWIRVGKEDIEKLAVLAGGNDLALREQIKSYYENSIKDQALAQDRILKYFAESKFISVGNYLGKKKIDNVTVYAFEILFDRAKFAKFAYDVASQSEKSLTLEAVERVVDMLSIKQIELDVMRDYTPRRLTVDGDIVLDEPSYETPKVNFSFDAQWLNINKKIEVQAPIQNVVGIVELLPQATSTVKEP